MSWVHVLIIVFTVALLAYGYLLLNTFYKRKVELDKETEEKNKELTAKHNELISKIASEETAIQALANKKKDLNDDITRISEESKAKAQETYDLAYDAMQERMSQSAEEASRKYRQAESEAKEQYLELLKEVQEEYQARVGEVAEVSDLLDEMKKKVRAANEEELRRLASEDKKKFYQIHITENQLWDIDILKKAVKELKGDTSAINKVIWEVYYKRPVTDLLNRVTPSGTPIIGIYKITNLDTNKCYIGQSVDIRTRFRDHIKAGLGINASNNRFYTEMKDVGPEHFMYEVIEECDRSRLNERERFWIDYFQSADYGFNTTRGNNTEE